MGKPNWKNWPIVLYNWVRMKPWCWPSMKGKAYAWFHSLLMPDLCQRNQPICTGGQPGWAKSFLSQAGMQILTCFLLRGIYTVYSKRKKSQATTVLTVAWRISILLRTLHLTWFPSFHHHLQGLDYSRSALTLLRLISVNYKTIQLMAIIASLNWRNKH